MKLNKCINIVGMLFAISTISSADTINGVSMDFVEINASGGDVTYNYRIGKSEVSIQQFQAFIADDGADANYDVYGPSALAPIVNITWHQAARYCNWLTTSNVNNGAYTIDGGSGKVTAIMSRTDIVNDGGMFYVLPTEAEWRKAAYFTGSGFSDYANGTSTIPVNETDAVYFRGIGDSPWDIGNGTLEQNGTLNMMGNVWEWTESTFGGEVYNSGNDAQLMAFRGGDWFLNNMTGTDFLISSQRASDDRAETFNVGMRVVAIPEPNTVLLLGISTLLICSFRRIFMI